MFLGNRLKFRNFLGNKMNLSHLSTLGNYVTPENIDKVVKLGIAGHKAYSDIERYRKSHD